MDENRIKIIINAANFDKKGKDQLKEYEKTIKMFDNLVESGVAEKNKNILSKSNSEIHFEFV